MTYKVTDIKTNAFKGFAKITKVLIGGNVEKINNASFKGCAKLANVTLGKSLKTIGKDAFSGCKVLKKITISSTMLKSVGKSSFKNIYKKPVIKVPAKKVKIYTKLFKKGSLPKFANVRK